VALRFLACSFQNALKPPALWLTALFRASYPELCQAWSDTLRAAKLTGGTNHLGLAKIQHNWSMSLIGSMQSCMTHAQFTAGGGWQGYDVVRLYTDIDQQDLNSALSNVFSVAWDIHADRHAAIQVYAAKGVPPKWWSDVAAVYQHYGVWMSGSKSGMKSCRLGVDAVYGQFYVFDRLHAQAVSTMLIGNTYVRFGPHL